MRQPLRVGAVNYLNTKPLIEGLGHPSNRIDLQLDYPSRLADRMQQDELDVGLIPVVEYFRAENYGYVPSIAIGANGPVLSVTLFSKVPWAEIRTVALDVGSRTSAALTEVLLRHRFNVEADYRPFPIDADAESVSTDAVLLIGDRAMSACLPSFRYAYDLGEEWTNWTGLPFVFALWAIRPNIDIDPYIDDFVQAKQRGFDNVGMIALREAQRMKLDPGYCRRYLTNIIRYDLGPRELAGMNHFRELALSLGLVPNRFTPSPLEGEDWGEGECSHPLSDRHRLGMLSSTSPTTLLPPGERGETLGNR